MSGFSAEALRTVLLNTFNQKTATNIGTAVAVADVYTLLGSEINITSYKTLVLFLDYTKGTEGGLKIKASGLHASGGSEYQMGEYTNLSGVLSEQKQEYQYTSTTKAVPIILDVSGYNYVKIEQAKISGTASGTVTADYIKTN